MPQPRELAAIRLALGCGSATCQVRPRPPVGPSTPGSWIMLAPSQIIVGVLADAFGQGFTIRTPGAPGSGGSRPRAEAVNLARISGGIAVGARAEDRGRRCRGGREEFFTSNLNASRSPPASIALGQVLRMLGDIVVFAWLMCGILCWESSLGHRWKWCFHPACSAGDRLSSQAHLSMRR